MSQMLLRAWNAGRARDRATRQRRKPAPVRDPVQHLVLSANESDQFQIFNEQTGQLFNSTNGPFGGDLDSTAEDRKDSTDDPARADPLAQHVPLRRVPFAPSSIPQRGEEAPRDRGHDQRHHDDDERDPAVIVDHRRRRDARAEQQREPQQVAGDRRRPAVQSRDR